MGISAKVAPQANPAIKMKIAFVPKIFQKIEWPIQLFNGEYLWRGKNKNKGFTTID
tara:strand:+ start:2350 stop:2517 length:168 start_codon:yes stop_codon:yes gene_type:complete